MAPDWSPRDLPRLREPTAQPPWSLIPHPGKRKIMPSSQVCLGQNQPPGEDPACCLARNGPSRRVYSTFGEAVPAEMPSGSRESLCLLGKSLSVPAIGCLPPIHAHADIVRAGFSLCFCRAHFFRWDLWSAKTLKSLAEKQLCGQTHLQNAMHDRPFWRFTGRLGSEKSC